MLTACVHLPCVRRTPCAEPGILCCPRLVREMFGSGGPVPSGGEVTAGASTRASDVRQRRSHRAVTSEPTTVNGNPGLILRLEGVIDGVLAFRVENARVTGLYYVRNPEKLPRVESETPLTSR